MVDVKPHIDEYGVGQCEIGVPCGFKEHGCWWCLASPDSRSVTGFRRMNTGRICPHRARHNARAEARAFFLLTNARPVMVGDKVAFYQVEPYAVDALQKAIDGEE